MQARVSSAGKKGVRGIGMQARGRFEIATPAVHGTKRNEDANVAAVLNGYPYNEFVALSNDMELPLSQLSKITGIASSTLNRRESKGKLTPPESDRLYLTKKVFNLAVEVTGSKENARIWLTTPQVSLNNERPIDYIRTIPGADIVINLLYAMEYGVYL